MIKLLNAIGMTITTIMRMFLYLVASSSFEKTVPSTAITTDLTLEERTE